MDNRNIAKVLCPKCIRSVEITPELEVAVAHKRSIVCQDCFSPLEVEYGDRCRHHGESLRKGFCNRCASDELMDNQI